ncbi:MAG: hypothetical protein LQ350_004872 [Teloschistes chrysophthalmus]|nr:MAG: hypothetical protein LQ350_004872 [Niorma chrysophthalma]
MASSGANTPAGLPTVPSNGTTTTASATGEGQTPLTARQKRNQRTKQRRKKARENKRAGQNAGNASSAGAAEDSDDSSECDDDAGDATPGPTPRTPMAQTNLPLFSPTPKSKKRAKGKEPAKEQDLGEAAAIPKPETPTGQQSVPSPSPTPTPKSKKAQGKEPAKEQNAGKSAPGPAPQTPAAQSNLPSFPPTPTLKRTQEKAPAKVQNGEKSTPGPALPQTPTVRQNQAAPPTPPPKSKRAQEKARANEEQSKGPSQPAEQADPATETPATPKESYKSPTAQPNLPSPSPTEPISAKAQGKAPVKEEQSKGPNEPAEPTEPKTTILTTPKEPTKTPTGEPNLASPTPTEPKLAKAHRQGPAQVPSRRERKLLRQQEKEAREAAEKGLTNDGADHQLQGCNVTEISAQGVNVADSEAQSTNVAEDQGQSTKMADDPASDIKEELGRGPSNEDPDTSTNDTDTEAGEPAAQHVEQPPIFMIFEVLCDFPFRLVRGWCVIFQWLLKALISFLLLIKRIFQWPLNGLTSFLLLVKLLIDSTIDKCRKARQGNRGPAQNTSTKRWFWRQKAPADAANLESEKKDDKPAPENRDSGAPVEPVEQPAQQASSWLRPWKRTIRADAANGNPEEATADQAPEADEAASDDEEPWEAPVGEPTPIARGLSWLWRRIARGPPAVAEQGPENAAPETPAVNAVPPPAERDEQAAQDQNADLAWEPATLQDLEDFLHYVLQPPWLIFTYAMMPLAGLWRRKGLIALAILILSAVGIPLCSYTDLSFPTDSPYLTDFYDDPSHLDDLVSSLAKIQDVAISTASTKFVPNEAFLKSQNLQIPALRGSSYATERENFVDHFIRVKVAVDNALSEFDRRSATAGVDLLHLARPEEFESKKRGTKKFLRTLSHLLEQQTEDMNHIGVSLEKIPPLLTDGDTLRQLDDVYRQRAWFQWPFYDLHTRHVFRDSLKSLERYYIRQTGQMERARTTLTALREGLAKQRGWGLINLGIEEKAWSDVAEMIEWMLRTLDEVGAWNRRFSHGN